MSTQLKNQHLLWRAGFGPAAEQLADLSRYSPAQFYSALVKASAKKPLYIDVADNYLEGLYMGVEQAGKVNKELTPEEKRKVQQKKPGKHKESESLLAE